MLEWVRQLICYGFRSDWKEQKICCKKWWCLVESIKAGKKIGGSDWN